MVKCPSCARLQEPRLVCSECEGPLAAEIDCFAALGLPKKLEIEQASLERAYYDIGRRVHPDRFAVKPVAVRDASLRATALLTRSYRILRDPVSRGLYWLELNGQKLAENNQQVPADLAELIFDVQEMLAQHRVASEARNANGDRLNGDVSRHRRELDATLGVAHVELARIFARMDADDGSARNELIKELKSALSAIAYLRRLLRDVDKELATSKAA